MNFRFAVVDDATFIREIIKNIGEGMGGVCVGEGDNGRNAIEVVRATLPDILFLDLVMPLRNGLEILDEIQELWPVIKIVICTTLDQDEMIEKLKQKGVEDYITKPFSKSEIEDVIQKLMTTGKDESRV